jgi:hypothetical protein
MAKQQGNEMTEEEQWLETARRQAPAMSEVELAFFVELRRRIARPEKTVDHLCPDVGNDI